jgi:hypothetical protein
MLWREHMIEILLACALVGMWYSYMTEFEERLAPYRKSAQQQLHRRIANTTNKVNYCTRKDQIDDLGLRIPRRQEEIADIVANDLTRVQQLAKRHHDKPYGKHLACLCCAYDLFNRKYR